MALQSTQLASAITANQTQFSVASAPSSMPAVGAPPLPVGVPTQIDSEFMYTVQQPAANLLVVRGRGSDGTAASAHDILSNVYCSNQPGDFPAPQPGTFITTDPAEDAPVSLGQDQTVPLLGSNTVYNINKATAAALVLLAPSLADNGVSLVFTSNTAAAHVITATSLINDGSGATPKTTATFTATKGASVTFVIENGFYNVLGTALGVTFA